MSVGVGFCVGDILRFVESFIQDGSSKWVI